MTETQNANESELIQEANEGTSKTKKYIIICAIVAAVGLIGWLAFGTVNSYTCDTDRNDIKEDLNKKNRLVSNLTEEVKMLREKNKNLTEENDELKDENEELNVRVGDLSEENTILRRQVAAKDIIIQDLHSDIAKLNHKIEQLNRHIHSLNETIEELEDSADEIYSDMRLIGGILNQELNRNQALVREIDSLDGEIKKQEELIGQYVLKISGLNEELTKEKYENAMMWLKNTFLEEAKGKKVKIEKVYSGSPTECGTESFYNKIKDIKPNLFLATERNTGYIFGGYTGETWTEAPEGFKPDATAFTFSGTNRLKCTIQDTAHAINTLRKRDNKDYMLTFGNTDIALGQDCFKSANHLIKPNVAYKCPAVEKPEKFYTRDEVPTLSSFEFFTVTYEEP